MPTTAVTPRTDLDAAVLTLAVKGLRIAEYEAKPAVDPATSEPLPLPLRYRIAYNTARRNLKQAEAAYVAAYPKTKRAKQILANVTL